MTENKRFTYDYEDDKYYDKGFFKDNGRELFKDELLDLLNALYEENEALKLDNKLLLGEIKEIRDKLTVYLQIQGIK